MTLQPIALQTGEIPEHVAVLAWLDDDVAPIQLIRIGERHYFNAVPCGRPSRLGPCIVAWVRVADLRLESTPTQPTRSTT